METLVGWWLWIPSFLISDWGIVFIRKRSDCSIVWTTEYCLYQGRSDQSIILQKWNQGNDILRQFEYYFIKQTRSFFKKKKKKSGTNMVPNLFTECLTNKPISGESYTFEKEKNVKVFLTHYSIKFSRIRLSKRWVALLFDEWGGWLYLLSKMLIICPCPDPAPTLKKVDLAGRGSHWCNKLLIEVKSSNLSWS